MLTAELIRRKRDGLELSAEEIAELVSGVADGTVTDAQVGALAMAIVWRGMSPAERVALTGAMTRSGDVLDWSGAGLGGPVLDKHSTGGVGDKVSLLLAPMLAACGAFVPMISGRGLGHTGGTLDKLESIPLIVASILSKKLAAGLDALVMDVKVGSGAMLPSLERARELAGAIVEVAVGNGLPTVALLTDMDQVLGRSAGNAVEVRESIDHLTGAARDERLLEVTLALCAEALVLGGLCPDVSAARAAALRALESGAAAERFGAMAAELGGPAGLMDAPSRHLESAPVVRAVDAASPGVVARIDVRAIGIAIVNLGGGRAREDDQVDHSVGLTEVAALGDAPGEIGRPVLEVQRTV